MAPFQNGGNDEGSHLGPKYLVDVIIRPHSASSNRPLSSSNRLDLLVPRSRTALAQPRSFASIGPALWTELSPSVRSTFFRQSLVFLCVSQNLFFLMGPCTLAAFLNGSPY